MVFEKLGLIIGSLRKLLDISTPIPKVKEFSLGFYWDLKYSWHLITKQKSLLGSQREIAIVQETDQEKSWT